MSYRLWYRQLWHPDAPSVYDGSTPGWPTAWEWVRSSRQFISREDAEAYAYNILSGEYWNQDDNKAPLRTDYKRVRFYRYRPESPYAPISKVEWELLWSRLLDEEQKRAAHQRSVEYHEREDMRDKGE
jgi:hypothetical protein